MLADLETAPTPHPRFTDNEYLTRIFNQAENQGEVERAFYEAGKSLKELRDKRLYRSTHRTFEEYCRERFGYNRSRSYQFIDAALEETLLQAIETEKSG